MQDGNFRQHLLTLTCMAIAFAMTADAASTDDVSKRYGSLVELFASDAYVKAEQLPYQRISDSVVNCRFLPDRKIRQTKVRFVSQTYRGKQCPHEAIMCLPIEELSEVAKGTTAIVLGGNVLSVKKAELDWVEHIVVAFGVPCFVVMQTLDAKAHGARNPGQLMSFGNKTYYETGDPTGDYRRAKWSTNEITIPQDFSQPFHVARVERPESGTTAIYLGLTDHHKLCDSIIHSNIVEIGQPAKHELTP